MISPEEQKAAQQQAQQRAAVLANAFVTVFGQVKNRTNEQKLVIEHLAICAGDDGNSYRLADAKDGVALIAAGIHRDGAKSMLRVIERQLSIAANAAQPKKAKPVTKR